MVGESHVRILFIRDDIHSGWVGRGFCSLCFTARLNIRVERTEGVELFRFIALLEDPQRTETLSSGYSF